jgi:Alginate lyase
VSPGGNFDLSGWQLQLPIGSTGSPTMISGSQLAGSTGFTDIYFYTDKTDGAMTFMDPTTGVTTSGSLHPRSELREVTNGWPTTGTNTETVTVAVTQVPSTVTIGQIFQSPPAPSKPLLELQYLKGGTLQILLENTNQGGSSTFHTVGTVTDGSQFTYELSLTGTTITITIDGTASTFTLPSSFVGESFYFKCGDYDQTAVAGTPGTTPGTVVKIYALDVVHQ